MRWRPAPRCCGSGSDFPTNLELRWRNARPARRSTPCAFIATIWARCSGRSGVLFYWTGRRLAGALRPAATSVVPFLVLMLLLDPFYGQRPLAAGERVVITARLDSEQAADAAIEGRGLVVETPGVRFADGRRVSWRIRGSGGAGSAVLSAGSTKAGAEHKMRGDHFEPARSGVQRLPGRSTRRSNPVGNLFSAGERDYYAGLEPMVAGDALGRAGVTFALFCSILY